MSHAELAKTVDDAFEQREGIGPSTKGAVRDAVEMALDLLDRGKARVAEKGANGNWRVNQWLKKAVLLSFRLNDMSVIDGGPGKAVWWDKVASN
jgi:2,3,4,5-tetrahydropyridine-2-carboxylate N-succinyltransferase